MNKKYVIVSFSGGMDSTCLILHLLSQGFSVRAYGFDYGQAHNIELKKAKNNIKYMQHLGLDVSYTIINLRDVFAGDTSTLVRHDQSPYGDYREENMKQTVVGNRNVIFSAIIFAKALSLAKLINNKVYISLGVHAGDHQIYPDCRPESVSMARELYKISNWDSDLVDYYTPFVECSKAEVLKAGIDAAAILNINKRSFNTILSKTISCYNATSTGLSCGKCGTCRERLEAFELNNMKDPAKYIQE